MEGLATYKSYPFLMKLLLLSLAWTVSLFPFSAHGQDVMEADKELASQEELYTNRKGDFANPKVDHPERPNVLLIGDSISIGYTPFVRSALQQKVDVYRIPTNGQATDFGLENLDKWLAMKPAQWDLIHFNWGLWDLCYRHPESKVQGHRDKVNGTITTSLTDFRSNLEKIVLRLKETEATLIWCAITPVPEDEAGRKVGDDGKYNEVAAEVMKKHGVLIDDLHSYALKELPGIGIRKGDVHFTRQGCRYLAVKVAQEISTALEEGGADRKSED